MADIWMRRAAEVTIAQHVQPEVLGPARKDIHREALLTGIGTQLRAEHADMMHQPSPERLAELVDLLTQVISDEAE
jgi:hypothetical protein